VTWLTIKIWICSAWFYLIVFLHSVSMYYFFKRKNFTYSVIIWYEVKQNLKKLFKANSFLTVFIHSVFMYYFLKRKNFTHSVIICYDVKQSFLKFVSAVSSCSFFVRLSRYKNVNFESTLLAVV
jgi:hypothetical protein